MTAELAVIQQTQSLVRPIASPAEIIRYHDEITKIIQQALKEGTDYGTIPGTNKPSLYKAGAERLCLAFGAHPEYEPVKIECDHDREVKWLKKKKKWNNAYKGDRTFTEVPEEGVSLGIYRYVYNCKIVLPDGRILGQGQGVCSTLESKYIDRPRDCENVVCKMSQKRSFTAAVLHSFGLSDRFTQDLEDQDFDTVVVAKPAQAQTKQEEKPAEIFFKSSDVKVDMLHEKLRAAKISEDMWAQIEDHMEGKAITRDNFTAAIIKVCEPT